MQIDTSTASERLERETHPVSRRRGMALAVAGFGAAVALGVVVWNQGSSPRSTGPAGQPSDTQPSATPYLLDLSTGEQTPLPEQLVPDPALGFTATYSQDGTAVALECAGATCSGPNRLEVVSADGRVSVIPVPAESSAETLAWSRDGTGLLYRLTEFSRDLGDLFVYDLDLAVSTQITDLPIEDVYWVDLRAEFSPDGQTVVFHRPRGHTSASKLDVWTVPVTGGEPTRVFRNAAQPEFLPDGRRIAFVQPETNSLTGKVVAAAAPGHPPQPLFETPEDVVVFHLSPDGTRALTSGDNGTQLVDVASGEVSDLALDAQWAGNDTLLVEPEN